MEDHVINHGLYWSEILTEDIIQSSKAFRACCCFYESLVDNLPDAILPWRWSVQYFGGCPMLWGTPSVHWRMFSTVVANHQFIKGCSVLRKIDVQ